MAEEKHDMETAVIENNLVERTAPVDFAPPAGTEPETAEAVAQVAALGAGLRGSGGHGRRFVDVVLGARRAGVHGGDGPPGKSGHDDQRDR